MLSLKKKKKKTCLSFRTTINYFFIFLLVLSPLKKKSCGWLYCFFVCVCVPFHVKITFINTVSCLLRAQPLNRLFLESPE